MKLELKKHELSLNYILWVDGMEIHNQIELTSSVRYTSVTFFHDKRLAFYNENKIVLDHVRAWGKNVDITTEESGVNVIKITLKFNDLLI
jgi:hypothetical protein